MEVDFGELNPPPPSMEDMHARVVSSVSVSLRHMVDHGFNPSAVDSDNGEGDVPEDEDEFVVNVNAEVSRCGHNQTQDAHENAWYPWKNRLVRISFSLVFPL